MKKKWKSRLLLILFFLFWNIFITLSLIESAGYFIGIDQRIQNLAIFVRTPFGVNFFQIVTFLGSWRFIFPVTIIASLILWKYKKNKYILPLLVLVFVSFFSNEVLKFVYAKPRPLGSLVSEQTFAFPSGHAVLSVLFYGLLAYCGIANVKRSLLKVIIVFFSAILIFLISFSRIYLSAHFYSDVLAGFWLGAAWFLLGIIWFKIFNYKKNIIYISLLLFILLNSLLFISFPRVQASEPLKTVREGAVLDVFDEEKLPKFTEKLDGSFQQPLSFFITAKDDQEFIGIFEKSGWTLTEKFSFAAMLRSGLAAHYNQPYKESFISPTFWDFKTQDFSFAKLTSENTVRIRHHCRFWRTNIEEEQELLYVGYCSFDKGVKPWLITHEVDSDLDKERDFLFNDIKKSNQVEYVKKIDFVGKTEGANFQGDYFYTDGNAYLINLR